MSGSHYSINTLSSAEIPLIHVNKAPSHSQASLQSGDTQPLSVHSKNARTFRQSRSNTSLEILTDVLFALFSAVFFVYGIYVARYNGKPVADHTGATNALINATKIGPTIFPILFAAVLGRALRALMLWRLERGERLGLLDLLAGSTTVVNTILTQVSLRMLNMAGLILIIAWAISPLGGQASLRVMTVAHENFTSTCPVRYMSTNHSFGVYSTMNRASLATLIDGIFNAALLGPERIKSSPVDSWNNVKVPRLESITTDQALLANNSWIVVPDQNVTYASLIGLPVADLPGRDNATFNMETFYWRLECSKLTRVVQPQHVNLTVLPAGWSTRSNGNDNIQLYDYAPLGFNGSYCRGDPYDPEYVPRVLAYNSWDPSGSHFGAMCTIWTTYVEVEIRCSGNINCSATAIRNSTQRHPTPAWTMLDAPERRNCNWFSWVLYEFIGTVNIQRDETSTPAQGYLLDPNSPASPSLNKSVTTVPKEIFGIRLAQLLNTFWSIRAGPYAILYGFAGDVDNTHVQYYDLTAANATSTTAQLTKTFEVIRCHRAWLTVLLCSSVFLIIASIVSTVLRLRSKTPDLSLNWSTMTRDNPYINTNCTASSLDHTKRSRMMKSQKVRFGDVEPEREVGHLAIGSLESHAIGKSDRSRLFD